jgi:DNA-binding SARP family transcriptional activator
MYLEMLEKLMLYYENCHDYDAGIQYGMRIIACDKVHERTYRHLMRLHYLSGNRAKALHLYEQCSRVLDEELGVKPSQCTKAFYKQILAEHLTVPEPAIVSADIQRVPEDTNAHLIDALNSLTHLQEILTDLQGEIQQSTLRAE